MKYLSLFSGIGGFELGIIKAYEKLCIKNKKQKSKRVRDKKRQCGKLSDNSSTRFTCIGYSEIDKYAIQIYEKHFKHKNWGDVTKIIASELPDFELLVGGFPCQAFSIAGKRKGFDDTRGTLFFDITRILKEKRPRNFILENVKGLLSHDGGRTFKTIISTLTELGYCVEWQVLNAKNFGVPQNRERVFIVGHFGGLPERKVFPIRESNGGDITEYGKGERIFANTLKSRDYKGGGNLIKEIIPYADGRKGRSSMHAHRVPEIGNENHSIRRLTPLECERLMGYPETKKYVILELCYDQAKSCAFAVLQNPKLRELVLSVEKGELNLSAEFAEKLSQLKNQPTDNSVQENATSFKTESNKKQSSSVKSVGKKKDKVHQDKGEDSAHLNVLIDIIEGRIILNGKEEFRVKELRQMAQEDGQNVVSLSGEEIMQLVSDAKDDSLTEKIKPLMSTISSDSEIKKLDMMLVILYFYALNVIDGFTQEKIQNQSLLLGFRTINGYTEGISDTQRYKTLGNGVVSNVVAEVINGIFNSHKIIQ